MTRAQGRARARPRAGGMLRDVAPPALVAAGIMVAATIPVPEVPVPAPGWADLAAHALMYAVLAAALLWTWARRGWPHPAASAFCLALAYGVLHEVVQAFLPWRSAAVLDVVADGVGAAAAVGVHLLRVRARARHGHAHE